MPMFVKLLRFFQCIPIMTNFNFKNFTKVEKYQQAMQIAYTYCIPYFSQIAFFLVACQQEFFAFSYLFGIAFLGIVVPVLFTCGVFFFESYVIPSKKHPSDPTDIRLFERLAAAFGLLLPTAEFVRYFIQDVNKYDTYQLLPYGLLANFIIFLQFNQLIIMLTQITCFREVIRRKGPDTVWKGRYRKIWIKNFVRYYWCYGFCLTSLLEPYNFFRTKVLSLFAIPREVLTQFQHLVFFSVSFCIIAALVGIMFGTHTKIPLIHGACVFHIGRQKELWEVERDPKK